MADILCQSSAYTQFSIYYPTNLVLYGNGYVVERRHGKFAIEQNLQFLDKLGFVAFELIRLAMSAHGQFSEMATIVDEKLFQCQGRMIMQKHAHQHKILCSVVTIIHAFDFISYGFQVFCLSAHFVQWYRLANYVIRIFHQLCVLINRNKNQ